MSQLSCYSCSSWQRLGVSACAQFDIFVVKVGSTCENETDSDEKRIFHYKLSKKLSEAHRNISFFFKIGETRPKRRDATVAVLAQVMSLGIVIHNVVVQFDNPPFHPIMAGEMLSYRSFSSKN